jgi:hypothetical protein
VYKNPINKHKQYQEKWKIYEKQSSGKTPTSQHFTYLKKTSEGIIFE